MTDKLTVMVMPSVSSHVDLHGTYNKPALAVYSNENSLYILTVAAQNCLEKHSRNQNHRQRWKAGAGTHIHCSLIAPAFVSASAPIWGQGQVASHHLVQ